jgi:hypothetical protein
MLQLQHLASRPAQPRVVILFRQDSRHALLPVVDARHRQVRWLGDDHEGSDRCSAFSHGADPDTSEGEGLAISEPDVRRLPVGLDG